MDTLKPLDYAVVSVTAWMIMNHVKVILIYGQNGMLTGVLGIWLFWTIFNFYCNWRSR
jgi:hypothetical protein